MLPRFAFLFLRPNTMDPTTIYWTFTAAFLAGMVHVNGTYGRVTLRTSVARYAMDPVVPAGSTNDYVVMGAYNAAYLVASEATLYGAGLSYRKRGRTGPTERPSSRAS